MPRLAIDEQRRFERAALMDEPPRVRKGPGKPLLLIAAGALLAALLLVVLFNIDRAKPQAETRVELGTITDIVPPKPLEPGATAATSRGTSPLAHDAQVELPEGGWIQVTNPQGQLAQQYRFERFDPKPEGAAPGYVRMERPNAEVYLSGGRVLTLSGDSALAYVPKSRMLESGDLTGNVVIRLFEPRDGGSVHPTRDTPALVVRTAEARFDSVLGEVACPNEVHVQTASGEYHGSNLSLSINDKDGTVQNLVIERTKQIRLAAGAMKRDTPNARLDEPSPTPVTSAPTPQGPAASAAAELPSSSPSPPTAPPSPSLPPPPPPPAAAPAQNPTTFYRLTLHDNVVITQGDASTGRKITGDELMLIFAMKGDASMRAPRHSSLAAPATPQDGAPSQLPATGLSQTIIMLVIAAGPNRDDIAPPAAPDDIHITCRGKLIMTPLTDPALKPNSPDDARMVLRGAPVTLFDHRQRAQAKCALLTHSAASETTELIGSSSHPLVMSNPQFDAEGERFWWQQGDSSAGFAGPGRINFRRDIARVSRRLDQPRLWAGAVVMAAAMIGPEPAARPIPEGDPSLRISWSDSVDLKFDETAKTKPGDESGQLKTATFNGDVEVISEQLFVNADKLAVNFAPTPGIDSAPGNNDGNQQPESIHAEGSVFCKAMQQTGTLRCGVLDVKLVPDGAGEPAPREIAASGNVEAMDAEKTIWAQSVFVKLKPAAAKPQAAEGAMPTSIEAAQQSGASLQNSDVEEFKAEGDVQLVLSNGVRLFADSMNGDSGSRQIELQGNPVQLVRDQLLFERDTRVIVTEQQPGLFHVAGPGKAMIFPKSIQTPGREKVGRPRIEEKPEMTASWTDELIYDTTFNNGQGSLDLRGQVDAQATPSPREHNFIKARAVTLEFEEIATEPGAADGGAKPQAAEEDGLAGLQQGDRSVRKLIARGDAELESRTWLNEDHGDTPRVFNLAGQLVEYDDRTGEALVVGDGRLLVRDERPTEPTGASGGLDAPSAADRDTAFGRKGTTLFKWQQKLHMTRSVDQLYDILIHGDVSVQHKGLGGETATLTCGELQVELLREPTATSDESSAQPASAAAFDLGGSADLRYLRAEKAVYIRTPTRDVDCGRFVLNYKTQIAELAAAPGGTVSILQRETGMTQQVEQAVWNLATDVITIERGASTIGR